MKCCKCGREIAGTGNVAGPWDYYCPQCGTTALLMKRILGGARRKMKRMGIGQLKKEITAKKIIAWGPMEIMADGEVAGVLLPPKHEGTLAVRETEAKRTGKQEGTQAKVLAFGKEKQAAGKMRQGG